MSIVFSIIGRRLLRLRDYSTHSAAAPERRLQAAAEHGWAALRGVHGEGESFAALDVSGNAQSSYVLWIILLPASGPVSILRPS
jgi:hypothetical protein